MKSKKDGGGSGPRSADRRKAIERGDRLSDDLRSGLRALEVITEAAAGFPALDRNLRRLEHVLEAIRSGELKANLVATDKVMEDLARLRLLVSDWRRAGSNAARLARLAKSTHHQLSRVPAPPRELVWCVVCQERAPFFGGPAGGLCKQCIGLAHSAVTKWGDPSRA